MLDIIKAYEESYQQVPLLLGEDTRLFIFQQDWNSAEYYILEFRIHTHFTMHSYRVKISKIELGMSSIPHEVCLFYLRRLFEKMDEHARVNLLR